MRVGSKSRGSATTALGAPRVTIKRMLASRSPLRRQVWTIAARQLSRVIAVSSRVARSESKKRSMCWSSLKIEPRQAETTSKTPSPSKNPWSSTDILASLSGTKSPLR